MLEGSSLRGPQAVMQGQPEGFQHAGQVLGLLHAAHRLPVVAAGGGLMGAVGERGGQQMRVRCGERQRVCFATAVNDLPRPKDGLRAVIGLACI